MDRLQWRRASQGFEAIDREAVKLGQDLALMDRGNGEEKARSRIDGLEHIIHDCINALVGLVLWRMEIKMKMKWKCPRQRYNLGHYISPV